MFGNVNIPKQSTSRQAASVTVGKRILRKWVINLTSTYYSILGSLFVVLYFFAIFLSAYQLKTAFLRLF